MLPDADFRADLHCHSLCSDGSLSPEELVEKAIFLGLKGLSITDHDSIAGYETAVPLARKLNLPLVSGVEFSATHRNTSVHLLAYGFSLNNPIITQLCVRHHERRQLRYQKILALLKTQRIELLQDEELSRVIQRGGSVGRPHIAAAMVRQKFVSSMDAAFRHYLGEGRPCYVSFSPVSVEETVELIHSAGALCVIAHPHLIRSEVILNDLLAMPMDGIEAYYSRFSLEQSARWLKVAVQKGWIVTGGSDFHGEAKPQIPLGASWAPKETFSLLLRHFQGAA